VIVDQWQLEKLALCGVKHPVLFYTPKLDKTKMGALGSWAFDDLDCAVAAMVESLPKGARVALIPEGPYTFARAE
jgi:hypothetical protein